MAKKLVIKVTAGADAPERCSQAFTVAAVAVASGVEVSLWLTGESAWFALPGARRGVRAAARRAAARADRRDPVGRPRHPVHAVRGPAGHHGEGRHRGGADRRRPGVRQEAMADGRRRRSSTETPETPAETPASRGRRGVRRGRAVPARRPAADTRRAGPLGQGPRGLALQVIDLDVEVEHHPLLIGARTGPRRWHTIRFGLEGQARTSVGRSDVHPARFLFAYDVAEQAQMEIRRLVGVRRVEHRGRQLRRRHTGVSTAAVSARPARPTTRRTSGRQGSSHQRSSGPRRLATIAANGGMTMATTHIPTATGTDQSRTTPQARTNNMMQTPIMAKYLCRRRAYIGPG